MLQPVRFSIVTRDILTPSSSSSGSVRILEQGAVLGVFPDWIYEDSIIELGAGDRLLLY